MNDPSDLVYESVAAFAGELVRRGVTEVVISPGSRSTPLTIGLHAQPALRTWVQLDERSAGFFALGLGRATGLPAVLVCTSGTAAANYLPAVVEAHHASVPLIVCTADRPPELRDWGAGQTIDQVKLYGALPRWSADLPVAGEVEAGHYRLAAMRAVSAAVGDDPGPVHLNWPFREPLEPIGAVPVEAARPGPTPVPDRPTDAGPTALSDLFEHERGVIVVGPPSGVGTAREQERAEAVGRFAAAAAWPVIGEPLTHVRRADMGGALVVTAADLLLGDGGFSQEVVPEVVVRIGRAPTTKPVRLWLERHRPGRVVHVDSTQHWSDAGFTLTDHVALDPARALAGVGPARSSSGWLDRWREAEELARAVISRTVDGGPLLSAAVARILLGALSPESLLMVSNSMPVRELDTFSGPELGPVVVGNRGASGIDGVNSTALGLAAARPDRSAALFTGDLALLHDLGGLLAAARLGLHLTIVCVDNNGGGIFSMLPIARRGGEVDFEQLFLTPPGIELTDLDGLGGIRARTVESGSDLADAITTTMSTRSPGVDLLVVPVDGDADVAQHRAVAAAVSAELAERR